MSKPDRTDRLDRRLRATADPVGNIPVDAFHYPALFAIGGIIIRSAVMAFIDMARQGGAPIHDILLLFIHLELGAMVGIRFKTRHMPVRFLSYVAVTALVRMLLDDVHQSHEPNPDLLNIGGAILMPALANLVMRYNSARFPDPAPRSDTDCLPTTP